MKNQVLYLDCFAGVAGDMLLGALLDLGTSEEKLRRIPEELGLDAEMSIFDERKGVERGKRVVVEAQGKEERKLADIREIIEESSLPDEVKEGSIQTFEKLGEAEGYVHGMDKNEVHFHEVGGVDSIVDIVGTHALLNDLDPSEVYCSEINLGRGGFIESAHGRIPNPAPATAELMKDIPVFSGLEGEETVTPTGAALIGDITDEFGSFPDMRIKRIGKGAGKKDFPIPNILRAFVGESEDDETSPVSEKVIQLETNIDDSTPEILGHTMEELFDAGALEVYQIPVQMKKNRSGVQLTVLCYPSDLRKIEQVLFEETSTFGYRYMKIPRRKLRREKSEVQTKYGKVKVKVGRYGESTTVAPEYEDCRKIAKEQDLNLREVYREALRKFQSEGEEKS
ncbi:hypothetical protein AKJ65_02825 [candidate division MSBL1 archaeon SCGC-AAA259E19]|uniref:Putative nickel insertion protein n=1 Tax=candidate division MSBL1 archaeon SCGC-AAA259E19 TaxID=1698264 RepID=A0A133ULB9_9EURY|nr:hypothetical protein AKJ65_02825 [candidate division MSBL1 archaeon SCGC-AAA259E19]